jgi:hypothetical protein
MKVLIPVCNNPEFLRFQKTTLAKYMPEPYTCVVFNDAKDFPDMSNYGDVTLRDQIAQVCAELGMVCIPVQNIHHRLQTSPSHRHADTLRQMMLYMLKYPDEYLILDSDMFPIGPIPIEKYREFPCGAIVEQQRGMTRYIWPNLFFFDMRTLPNKEILIFDVIPGCDSGGASNLWLSIQDFQHPQCIFRISHLPSCTWTSNDVPYELRAIRDPLCEFLDSDERNKDGKYWCEIYDGCFLHYRAGSNWLGEGREIHTRMTKKLGDFLHSL